PGSLRRRRSSSGDNMAEQHSAKRSRRFETDICREYRLEEDALDSFAKLDTKEMLTVVFAKLLTIERAREHDEVSAFIHSKQFKVIMKDRMRSILLSPNLTGYLSELPENIWSFMSRNLAMFKIPSQALEDPDLTEFIDGLMKDVLMQQRSMIESKIKTAVNKHAHISQLGKSLAPPRYYEVTTHQWGRFAFLRASLETFNGLVEKSMANEVATFTRKLNKSLDDSESEDEDHDSDGASERSVDEEDLEKEKTRSWNASNYWEYVDSLLGEIHSCLKGLTLEERKKEYDRFFKTCLQSDMQKYKPDNEEGQYIPAADHVTSELHRAIHEQLRW
ncbi:hypothetical protein V8E55_002589, partial [Tylopilus felleus]